MIVLEPGFRGANRVWADLVNMSQKEVEAKLKEDLPNVEFRVYSEDEYKMLSEEFYYQCIAVVVKNGMVVLPPKYIGSEPEFSCIKDPIGKDYHKVCDEIKQHIPSLKIVVKGEKGEQKWTSSTEDVHYAQVKVDKDDKVAANLTYIRVAKH